MYLLDTNVISELRQGKPQQSTEVRAWAATLPASQFFMSAICILELEKGVLAQSNAQLVAKAKRIIEDLGGTLANPREARAMLQLPSRA